MQPIKLTLSAFGSFKDTEVIDFTKVGRKGLYLISGDTGSGKTTILDGIVFALYGSPVSSSRSAEMMRNTCASDTDKTFAELVFEYGGKQYTVSRSLKYLRQSRKKGFAEEKPSACLTLPDGRIISAISDVNKEILKIIGLNKDNFIKVAILAQGKFSEMLFSSTSEKTEIFRSIFFTDKYEKLQKKLNEDHNAVSVDYKAANERAKEHISRMICSDEYAARLNDALSFNDKLAVAEEIIVSDKRSLDELSEKSDKNGKLHTEIVKKIERAAAAANICKNLNEARLSAAALEKALPELEEALRKAENELPAAEKLGGEIAVERSRLENFDKLAEYRNSAAKSRADCDKSAKKAETEKALAEKSKKSAAEYSAEYDEKEKAAEGRIRLEALLSEKKSRKNALEALIRDMKEYTRLVEEKSKLEADYAAKINELKKKRDEFDLLEDEFLNSQAGSIASKLKEGDRCPVCGNIVKLPLPAAMNGENVTKEMLDSAKQQVEDKRADADSALKRLSAASGVIGTKEETIKRANGELLGENTIPQAEKLNDEYALAAAEYKTAEDKAKIAAAAETRCRELEKLRQKAEQDANSHTLCSKESEREAAVHKAKAESSEAAAAELEKSMNFESRAQAEEKISVLESRKNAIENKYKSAKTAFDDNRSKSDRAAASIRTLEGQLKEYSDCTDCDLDELRGRQKESEDEKAELDKKTAELRDRIHGNTAARDGIAECIKDIAEVDRRISVIAPLYRAACGGTAEKITLEAYIQAEYLENITVLANQRLYEMSGGRYELRRTGKKVGNAYAGLDLNVYDYWSDNERSVKSLSGGESFEAALSLALGFSDEICSESGGISLESMFIDEGFGTLDNSSRDQAVKALQTLSQNGNRTVGVISHVDSLKAEITDCISVQKDKLTGESHIKIINN